MTRSVVWRSSQNNWSGQAPSTRSVSISRRPGALVSRESGRTRESAPSRQVAAEVAGRAAQEQGIKNLDVSTDFYYQITAVNSWPQDCLVVVLYLTTFETP